MIQRSAHSIILITIKKTENDQISEQTSYFDEQIAFSFPNAFESHAFKKKKIAFFEGSSYISSNGSKWT